MGSGTGIDLEGMAAEEEGERPRPRPRRVAPRSERLAAKRQEEQGYWIDLPNTGTDARIRRLSLADKAFVSSLPTPVQAKLTAALGSARQGQRSYGETVATLDDAARAICLRAFVEPRLVPTEADLVPGDESVWLVDDVHPADRLMVFNLCNGVDAEAAKRLEPFRPGPAGPLPVQPADEASQSPLRPVGDAGSGL